MSEYELEPLDPELRDLLTHERERPGIPDDVMSRLRNRLATAIPGLAGAPAGSNAGTSAPTASAAPRWALWHRPIPFALASFAVGGLVGAAVHAALSRPTAPIATPPVVSAPPAPATPLTPPTPVAPLIVTPPVAPPIAPPAVAHHTPRPPPPDAPSGRDTSLAAERALVEIARTALARGDLADCFETLRRHLQNFPDGQLVEERESLWVQALVNDGQLAAAKERATKFRQRFPHSLLLPAIDAAVQSIP